MTIPGHPWPAPAPASGKVGPPGQNGQEGHKALLAILVRRASGPPDWMGDWPGMARKGHSDHPKGGRNGGKPPFLYKVMRKGF